MQNTDLKKSKCKMGTVEQEPMEGWREKGYGDAWMNMNVWK
jgi:hypothetical protein